VGWNRGKPNGEVWDGTRCTPVDLKRDAVGSVVKGLSPSRVWKGYNGCSGEVVMDGSNGRKTGMWYTEYYLLSD